MLAFMIVGTVIFVLYIYFSIGIDRIVIVGRSLDVYAFAFYFGLSFLMMLIVMLLWTLSWGYLLKALTIKVGLKKLFLYYNGADFIDRFVPSPGVVGEFARAYFVDKDTSMGYGVLISAGITNRIISYAVVVVGFSLGILYLIVTQTLPFFASGLLLTVWLGAVILFAVLSFVSLKENAANTLISGLTRIVKALRIKSNLDGFLKKTYDFLFSFHEGFKFYRANPYYIIAPVILASASFVLNYVVYVLVFYALGLQSLPVDFYIVVYLLAGAIQDGLAAFSVGGLEILLTNIFILYNIPPATSGVAAVTVRIVTFYFPLILGYIFLQVIGVKNIWAVKPPLEQEMQ